MNEEDFLFSLYPNDLIEVEHKQAFKFVLTNTGSTLPKAISVKSAMVYYVKGGIGTGAIAVETHENAYTIKSLGVKTLKSIKKYQVDVLGNYYEVKKETRQTFR
jgi:CRISPR-associated endonuclease Csn1